MPEMDPNLGQHDTSKIKANVKAPIRKTNNKEEPNKCIECDFAFSQKSDLRRHLKIHSGEKSNKCNQCDFAFSRVSDLRRHWKTHSGEMSFKCNQCTIG